jgi:hypothetical protein
VTATGPASGTAGTAIGAASVSSVLAASSGGNSTGTITFKVFGPQASAPTTCTGGTTVGTATVSGNNTYNPNVGFTPSTAGDYWWYAAYGGDANNASAASTCGAGMSETVAKASPTVTATGPASGTAGTAITAASISSVFAASSGSNAGGTITYTVFGPQASAPTTCTSGGTTVGAATVSGNNTYHPGVGFTPSAAGNYWWYASYGGDTNNNAAASTCGGGMSETVVAAANSVTGIEWTSVTKPSNSTLSCSGAGTNHYSCTMSGGGNNSAVTAQIMFVNSSGVATVYSTSQSQTVTVAYDSNWKSGTGATSLLIGANATTSSGAPASGTEMGSNPATMTATFGTFTATLTVSP